MLRGLRPRATVVLLALVVAACGGSGAPAGGAKPTIPLRAGTLPPTFATQPSLVPATFDTPRPQPPSTAFGSPMNGARPPVRFTPQTIVDPSAGGVPAIAFLLPDGWQAQGGVQWLPEWSRVAHLATTIFDPSTGLTIDWLPVQDFIWFQPPGGLSAPIGGNYQGKAFVPQAQVAAERQASQDRIADLRGQALQGIDTDVNPFEGSLVQLPQGWVEYWVSPRGEYLTVDVPGFDPNRFDNQGWQRLQRRQ